MANLVTRETCRGLRFPRESLVSLSFRRYTHTIYALHYDRCIDMASIMNILFPRKKAINGLADAGSLLFHIMSADNIPTYFMPTVDVLALPGYHRVPVVFLITPTPHTQTGIQLGLVWLPVIGHQWPALRGATVSLLTGLFFFPALSSVLSYFIYYWQ